MRPKDRIYATSPLHPGGHRDRKSTRLNSSHTVISYAVFCLKKKNYASSKSPELIASKQRRTSYTSSGVVYFSDITPASHPYLLLQRLSERRTTLAVQYVKS